MKSNNLINRLFFEKWQVRKLVGEGNVKGGEIFQSSNFLFVNGHGNQFLFGVGGNDIVASGLGGPIMKALLLQTVVPIIGGFIGPGGDLQAVGEYNTRTVSNMNLGPSFMWLESCICGKLDGMYAKGNIGQSLLHAGVASLIASPTGSNIGGGYLEPKNTKYDFPIQTYLKYIKAKGQWKSASSLMRTLGRRYTRPPSLRLAAMAVVRAKLSPSRENHAAAGLSKATAISPPLRMFDSSRLQRNHAAPLRCLALRLPRPARARASVSKRGIALGATVSHDRRPPRCEPG